MIEFIEAYYNRRRPHSTIGYKVPAEAMAAFFERTEPKPEAMPMPPDSSSFRVRNLDTGQYLELAGVSASVRPTTGGRWAA